MKAFASFSFFLLFVFAAGDVQAQKQEHLIVSGGPALYAFERWRFAADHHDRYHFNFILPVSRARIPELQRLHGENAMITWLVYRPAYEKRQREDGQNLIGNIQSVRDKYGVRLVWFRTTDEFVRYINEGRDRRQIKIGSLDFFGHSNRHCFMFDYSSEILGCSKVFLHENDLGRLNRSAFAKSAYCKSWGCHTAESMSAKWRKATGARLWGAVGKTDYAKMSVNGWLPALSPGGAWRY